MLITSHKAVLQWWLIAEADCFTENEKMALSCLIFFNKWPNDVTALDTAALAKHLNPKPSLEGFASNKPIFNIKDDYYRVVAAIKKAYNVDIEVEEMHYHKFLAMFNAIVNNETLQQVLEYRCYKPGKNDSTEYKQHMLKMQGYYSINSKKKEVKNDDVKKLAAMILKGG